jgi:hypothetical protein
MLIVSKISRRRVQKKPQEKLEDGEYLYKGKSYCDDCYRAVKKAVTGNST